VPQASCDGVAVTVSRLRQRVLVTGQMDEARRMTYANWHQSLRCDLLRRAEELLISVGFTLFNLPEAINAWASSFPTLFFWRTC
jgi:hypothetical protein